MWQKEYSTDFEANNLLTQKPMLCIDTTISKNNQNVKKNLHDQQIQAKNQK
ncbi:MAG: hypothetical protein Ta2D_13790 [Rickettsiales bacterium]|nr:MAG: hypothetical protein Ta2D_13790 [Rickettsiales bacterium]